MLAIIKEESGHLTSALSENNLNVTGMKLAKKRKTLAKKADKNGYAIFDSQEQSVEDLAIYIDTYITPKKLSTESAAIYLEKNYSFSNGYARRILNLIK